MAVDAPSSPRILIVEDNEIDALLLCEALKKACVGPPLDMTVADRMSKALALLKERKFDLILSDLSLPDSDGMTTFTRLNERAPETPIILLTGFDSESLGLEAVRAGAQEYIVKGTMNEKALWRVISYAIERSALEKAVRDSEKRYKRLLGSVTDYNYTVKIEDGRIGSIAHNEACVGVTGYTPREMATNPELGQRMLEDEDRAAVIDQAAQAAAGHPVTLEHRIIHKDGSVRWVRHTTVLRKDEADRVTGYDGLISDITERKLAEIALRQAVLDLEKSSEALRLANLQLIQAEKMETVGRMAAGIAHELQNPLQIILMSLDYVTQRTAGMKDAALGEVVGEIRQAARRADGIIRGLLDFSHSDDPAFTRQDLNPLVESALASVQLRLVEHGIAVVHRLDPELPALLLDGPRMTQVIASLLHNAIDAMPGGGKLTVTTAMVCLAETRRLPGTRESGHFYAGDEAVVLTIEDTGTGIPEEAMRRIYEPFFTTKATGRGTGMGLAIARRIVAQHDGEMEILNRPEGGVHARILLKPPEAKSEESP